MSWLDDLVKQNAELESPQSFWYWSGLCAISAVVKDNVWLDRWRYKLYPNIYVMLHADSGLKKGPPVSYAKKIVRAINNTRIISGRSSIQGILKELSTAYTVPGGSIIKTSVGFIVASEFTSSLVADPAAMTILTDLYDRQYNEGEYKSLLKQESFELKDPTISMLVATNEAHFDDFIDSKDVKGGFIGRTFVIAETEVHRLNPLIAPPKELDSTESIIKYLKELSQIRGPFQPLGSREETNLFPFKKIDEYGERWFTGAGLLYDDWYMDFYHQVKKLGINDDTGTVQRFGDSVLKIAMLLSLSDSPDRIIQKEHMQKAITASEKLLGNVRRTTSSKKGKTASAEHQSLIISELLEREEFQITRQKLLQKYYFYFNASELDLAIQTLNQAGFVNIEPKGEHVVYTMPKKEAEKMIRLLEGKNQ